MLSPGRSRRTAATDEDRPLHYLAASALVSLVRRERETGVLRAFLEPGYRAASSELVLTEVPRALVRGAACLDREPRCRLLAMAADVLDGVALAEANSALALLAGRFDGLRLRSLDAVHLATALRVAQDLRPFVSYDRELLEPARVAALPVAAPARARRRGC